MNLWLWDLPDGNAEQGARVGKMNHKIIYISALQLFLLNYACSWLYFKPRQCAVHTSTKGICHSMCQAFNILTHLPGNQQQQPKRSSQACGHLPFISAVRTRLLPPHLSCQDFLCTVFKTPGPFALFYQVTLWTSHSPANWAVSFFCVIFESTVAQM